MHIAKAIRFVARSPFCCSLNNRFDAQLIRFVEAPSYEHASDTAAAVFRVDVENCQHWQGQTLQSEACEAEQGSDVRICGLAIL